MENNYNTPIINPSLTKEQKKAAIRTLFDNTFTDDSEWNRWFFECVYRDDEAMVLAPNGSAVSCLFLQNYEFNFHGTPLPMGYIAGAATARQERGRGYMSSLLRDALRTSYNRGDVFLSLVPANRRLYFFYDKFGFATVVFVDIERYTSLHTFTLSEGYTETEATWEDLYYLEKSHTSTVLHSKRDFELILEDIAHDKGTVSAITNPEGKIGAMAFATADKTEIHVNLLIGSDENAREMALAVIKRTLGEKPMVVYGEPSERKAMLRARAMMRIVNPMKLFTVLAKTYPQIDQVIRLRDNLITENNGYYIIKNGTCQFLKSANRRPILDVNIANMTKIIFSSEKIGEIFNLPTCHALLPLMLD